MADRACIRLLVIGVKLPAETFIRRKLEGLAASGLDVTITTHTSRREFSGGLKGVRILRLLHPESPLPMRLLRLAVDFLMLALTSAGQLRRLIFSLRHSSRKSIKEFFADACYLAPLARLHPDIVHFEWINVAVECRPLFGVWNRPVVVSCRGTHINVFPHLNGMARFTNDMREVLKEAAAVHCVSEGISREELLSGLDRTKIHIIRPAVDPNRFYPTGNRGEVDGVLRVITVSSLWWAKGYEYALIAIRLLRDRGVEVHYDIIGEGPDRQRVTYTIHDLHLQDAVSLHGALDERDVLERLRRADAFLLPSVSEGISNSVLEAMACGLPVVSSDCGGMREAIADAAEGFIVPNRDAVGMADALEKLAFNQELCGRLGTAARERVIREFNLDCQVDHWLKLYQQVLRKADSNS